MADTRYLKSIVKARFTWTGKHTGEKAPTKYWRFSIFLDFVQEWGTQSATVPAVAARRPGKPNASKFRSRHPAALPR